LLLLTDFWGENPYREIIGEALLGTLGVSVFVNFAKLAYNVTREVNEYLRKKRLALLRAIKIME
jgi:hypothetical protein